MAQMHHPCHSWRSDQAEASVGWLVVLPELCAMLPNAPDRAKGHAGVAAKKVCTLAEASARLLPKLVLRLVRGLQGSLQVVPALMVVAGLASCEHIR
jgi:hypothetical protein